MSTPYKWEEMDADQKRKQWLSGVAMFVGYTLAPIIFLNNEFVGPATDWALFPPNGIRMLGIPQLSNYFLEELDDEEQVKYNDLFAGIFLAMDRAAMYLAVLMAGVCFVAFFGVLTKSSYKARAVGGTHVFLMTFHYGVCLLL